MTAVLGGDFGGAQCARSRTPGHASPRKRSLGRCYRWSEPRMEDAPRWDGPSVRQRAPSSRSTRPASSALQRGHDRHQCGVPAPMAWVSFSQAGINPSSATCISRASRACTSYAAENDHDPVVCLAQESAMDPIWKGDARSRRVALNLLRSAMFSPSLRQPQLPRPISSEHPHHRVHYERNPKLEVGVVAGILPNGPNHRVNDRQKTWDAGQHSYKAAMASQLTPDTVPPSGDKARPGELPFANQKIVAMSTPPTEPSNRIGDQPGEDEPEVSISARPMRCR